ncbi:LamB/YcsF family protein [Bradyrhizobium sp. 61]|uniref:LamB/YcsF family protein n=1 Tax=Bradyrhizobium sp. 61 TaxID=2782679 RepID=UPI001FF79E04|nr:5-oxoprolinase subunit PxpA [Bradyrhizobium sp. 61]MCK1281065.1 LamB/YcsF family protein [Bradyrhizobium sp. 61]
MKIGINSDMGEGFGNYRICDDEALMGIISSANVACGFHAGDPIIMDRMVRLAKQKGVEVGAHPGLPDLLGFGRRVIQMDAAELEKHMVYQIGALQAIATNAGHRVTHVSFHAAMGNMVDADPDMADVAARAIATINRDFIVFSQPGAEIARAARKVGLRVLALFLADRAYDEHARLVSRKLPNSVITSREAVAERVKRFLDSGTVQTIEGKSIKIEARSILIHSDTPGSVELAGTVRRVIEHGGGEVVPAAVLLN